MSEFMKSEINSIQFDLSSENISILLEPDGANAGILITGSTHGVSTALERAKKLVDSVRSFDDVSEIRSERASVDIVDKATISNGQVGLLQLRENSTEMLPRPTGDSENITVDAEVISHKYTEHPVLIQNISLKSRQHASIWGLTILNKEPFVVKWMSREVEVYDSTDFSLVRQWKSKELLLPGDIVSCQQSNCLYVMDYNGEYQWKKIVRIGRMEL